MVNGYYIIISVLTEGQYNIVMSKIYQQWPLLYNNNGRYKTFEILPLSAAEF